MTTKSLFAFICAATTFALPAITLGDSPRPSADDLLTLEANRFRLTVARDIEAVDRLLDDELSYCHTTGKCETKAEYMANLKSGRTKYLRIDVLKSSVRRYGNVAILNGQISIDAEAGGQQVKGLKMSYTDVYRRTRTGWRMVAWHSSPLP